MRFVRKNFNYSEVSCRRVEKNSVSGNKFQAADGQTKREKKIKKLIIILSYSTKVSVAVETLLGGKFRQLFKSYDIDWCKFMKKGPTSSAIFELIFDSIKLSSSGPTSLMHRCPYFGSHAANISVSTSVIMIVPTGLYRVTCLVSNELDDKIFTFKGDILIGDQEN